MANRFVPRYKFISDITNAVNAVVSFTADHDFKLGENVSFRVSQNYGMKEMNNVLSQVVALTSDTITIDLDTRFFTAFLEPLSLQKTSPPVCVPSSSGISLNEPWPRYILTDVFDNIRT